MDKHMNNNIMVSVIMPVYNVEKYVGLAIESVQRQTLADFEFLIVDDGTKDDSGKICDAYAAKDARIHVIHKENGGAPSARNVAIDIAKGKYMYFMDSDDWVEPEMLEDMVALAESHCSQLVVAGFYIDTYYNEDEKFVQEQGVDDIVYATQREFREDSYRLFDRNLLYTPWNKLYLSSYILENRIYFPQTFWDDFPFNLAVVRDIERVCVTGRKYYHFIRKRAESETAKYRPDMYAKREEEHGWLLELYECWRVDTPQTREFLARRYIERVVGCIENVANSNCTLSPRQKRVEIKQMICAPRVREALSFVQLRSRYMKLIVLPMRWRNATLTYWEGRVISFVKGRNTKAFARLKAGR